MSCDQCSFGDEKTPDVGINSIHDDDTYSQGYREFVSCFRHSTKKIILSPDLTQKGFRSGIGNVSHVFHLRNRKLHSTPQIVEVILYLPRDINASILVGYALILKKKNII